MERSCIVIPENFKQEVLKDGFLQKKQIRNNQLGIFSTRICNRSTNQSNRSKSFRLLFLFRSRVFISSSHENRSILRTKGTCSHSTGRFSPGWKIWLVDTLLTWDRSIVKCPNFRTVVVVPCAVWTQWHLTACLAGRITWKLSTQSRLPFTFCHLNSNESFTITNETKVLLHKFITSMWNFSIKFKSINICWSKYNISASSHCLKRQKVYVKYLQKRISHT